MKQNARIEPLPDQDFRRYCLALALQIEASGVEYDVVVLPLRGAHHVWSFLSYTTRLKRKPIYIDVSRYREGETQSRHAPDFEGFPPDQVFAGLNVLILDDCTDDGDTMYETQSRIIAAGAKLVHTGVVLCKPDNLKIADWKPDFIGWAFAPGDIYYDFPGESFLKDFNRAKAQLSIPPVQILYETEEAPSASQEPVASATDSPEPQ